MDIKATVNQLSVKGTVLDPRRITANVLAAIKGEKGDVGEAGESGYGLDGEYEEVFFNSDSGVLDLTTSESDKVFIDAIEIGESEIYITGFGTNESGYRKNLWIKNTEYVTIYIIHNYENMGEGYTGINIPGIISGQYLVLAPEVSSDFILDIVSLGGGGWNIEGVKTNLLTGEYVNDSYFNFNGETLIPFNRNTVYALTTITADSIIQVDEFGTVPNKIGTKQKFIFINNSGGSPGEEGYELTFGTGITIIDGVWDNIVGHKNIVELTYIDYENVYAIIYSNVIQEDTNIQDTRVQKAVVAGDNVSVDGETNLPLWQGSDWPSDPTKAPIDSPTFTTKIVTPLIEGGSAVGSNIIYKSTTGIGTAAGIAHQFTGGTDGGTVLMTMLNNGKVGIGTASPAEKLHVSAGNILLDNNYYIKAKDLAGNLRSVIYVSTGDNIIIGSSGLDDIRFEVGGIGEAMRIVETTGHVGIGVNTPTAVLHLKAGTATAGTAPLKFTSGVVLDTPEPGVVETDGTNLFFTDSSSNRKRLDRQYKVYTALLSQSGTDAPTATILENTIGSIVWTRDAAGEYAGTLSGAFTADKTYVFIQSLPCDLGADEGGLTKKCILQRYDSDTLLLKTSDSTGTIDEVLNAQIIEIRVYF